MKIIMHLYVTSMKKPELGVALVKTVYSNEKVPVGSRIEDPGFHSKFHNGYRVAKVMLDRINNTCYLSLTPVNINMEAIDVNNYIQHLKMYGWETA